MSNFAREYDRGRLDGYDLGRADGYAAGDKAGRQAQKQADAALVRAAGCQSLRRCGHAAVHDGDGKLIGIREVHNPACPEALADAILEGR